MINFSPIAIKKPADRQPPECIRQVPVRRLEQARQCVGPLYSFVRQSCHRFDLQAMVPPQYSQQPFSSGIVSAPQ